MLGIRLMITTEQASSTIVTTMHACSVMPLVLLAAARVYMLIIHVNKIVLGGYHAMLH